MNNSINKNGISVCQAGEEKYVYFNLTPRPRRKGRYNTTVTRWTVSYLPPLPRLWSNAERNETSG